MFANLSGWHLLIILAVVLLLFGATRLPALSRSVGQSVRIFRSETKHLNEESDSTPDRDRLRPLPRQRARTARTLQWRRTLPTPGREVVMSRQARAGRDPQGAMSLGGHLNELAKRVTIAALALVAGMVARVRPLRVVARRGADVHRSHRRRAGTDGAAELR